MIRDSSATFFANYNLQPLPSAQLCFRIRKGSIFISKDNVDQDVDSHTAADNHQYVTTTLDTNLFFSFSKQNKVIFFGPDEGL